MDYGTRNYMKFCFLCLNEQAPAFSHVRKCLRRQCVGKTVQATYWRPPPCLKMSSNFSFLSMIAFPPPRKGRSVFDGAGEFFDVSAENVFRSRFSSIENYALFSSFSNLKGCILNLY